jgi:hypothetical protein
MMMMIINDGRNVSPLVSWLVGCLLVAARGPLVVVRKNTWPFPTLVGVVAPKSTWFFHTLVGSCTKKHAALPYPPSSGSTEAKRGLVMMMI